MLIHWLSKGKSTIVGIVASTRSVSTFYTAPPALVFTAQPITYPYPHPRQHLRQQNETLSRGLAALNTAASDRSEGAVEALRRELGRAMSTAQTHLETANALRAKLRLQPQHIQGQDERSAHQPQRDSNEDESTVAQRALQEQLQAMTVQHDAALAELSTAQAAAAAAERRARNAEEALEELQRRLADSETMREKAGAAMAETTVQSRKQAAAAASAQQEAQQLRAAYKHLEEKVGD